jgi:hypothetical protein
MTRRVSSLLLLTSGLFSLVLLQHSLSQRKYVSSQPKIKADFNLRGTYTVPFTNEQGIEEAALVIVTEVTQRQPSLLDIKYFRAREGKMEEFDRETLTRAAVTDAFKKYEASGKTAYLHTHGKYRFQFSLYPFAAPAGAGRLAEVDDPITLAGTGERAAPPVTKPKSEGLAGPVEVLRGWTLTKDNDIIAIRGSVRNTTDRKVRYWQLTINFLDADGNIIDSTYTNAAETLLPRAAKKFEALHKFDPAIKSARIYVEKFDFE